MIAPSSRDRFRAYDLDGAVHYFHPRSGTHVRIAGPGTRHVRKTAPRVVMFGVTNRCNLWVELATAEPGRALQALESVASEFAVTLWPALSDPDPTLAMLRRLRADLDQG
jgi:hypothetical protein